jgi:hypothetical protein
MKPCLVCFIILLLPFFGTAQKSDAEKKTKTKQNIYLDASAGASIPLGDYAGDDLNSETSGYAKPGFFIQANADWMGKKNFGLAFQLMYQNHSLSEEATKLFLYDTIDAVGPGNWSNIYIMAGPVFLKYIKKISVDAKLVGGFIISTCPIFETRNPETNLTEGGTATGLGLGVNIGVGYAVSQKVALKVTMGYIAGFPKIERQYNATVIGMDTTGHYIYSSPTDISRKRTVSTFNAGLGVIYKF